MMFRMFGESFQFVDQKKKKKCYEVAETLLSCLSDQ